MVTLKNSLIAVLTFGLLLTFGCAPEPGHGGTGHIHGAVESHKTDNAIPNAEVEIWYGETSHPSSDADDATTTNKAGEFEFEKLHKGDYFLHATGTDTSGNTVEGGEAVTIEEKGQEVEAHLHVE